jgi:hypothetical protein
MGRDVVRRNQSTHNGFHARNLFTNANIGFIDRAAQAFERYNGAEAINFARKTLSKVTGLFDAPRIMEYSTLQQFQQANTVMQRWIMAEPTFRTLYHKQMCDGYADTYVDMHPGKVGVDHYDWRRMNNSMTRFQPDGGYIISQYADELLEGDRAPVFSERVALQFTCEAVRAYAEVCNDDPTSPVGGKL